MSDDTLPDDLLTKYKKTRLYQSAEHKGKDEHLKNKVFYREGPEELTEEESLIDSPYYEDLRYIYVYPGVILKDYLIDLNTVKRIATENITKLFMKYPNIPRKDIIGTVMTELKRTCREYPPDKLSHLPEENKSKILIVLAVSGAEEYLDSYDNWGYSEITEESEERERVMQFIKGEIPDDQKAGGQRAGKRKKKYKKRKSSKRKKKYKKSKSSKRKKNIKN